MLTNLNADKNQFLQIILIGQPQLKHMLRSPQLAHFHLCPLDEQDVVRYIDHRLAAVGSGSNLFSDSACKTIAEASSGIPRTIKSAVKKPN